MQLQAQLIIQCFYSIYFQVRQIGGKVVPAVPLNRFHAGRVRECLVRRSDNEASDWVFGGHAPQEPW